jgi:hypothetical protein
MLGLLFGHEKEIAHSSETPVNVCQTIRRQTREESTLQNTLLFNKLSNLDD